MSYLKESLIHWWNNDNCFTRNYIIDSFLDLCDDHPLWEVDELSYALYKKEIKKIRKKYKVTSLNYSDEQKLIELKCSGCSDAFEKLLYFNLPYVISIAIKYQNLGLPLNDLISEGNLGLIEAIKKIEARGFRVSTYAKWYIKSYIETAINKYGAQIYRPSNVCANLKKIQKVVNKLKLLNGYSPIYEEIAETCNLDTDLVEYLMLNFNFGFSLERFQMCFDESYFLDSFMNLSIMKVDEDLYKESLRIDMAEVLSTLYDREIEILKMFFGIGCNEMELEEIGKKFDLTKERVRQIKEKAIRRLKGDRSTSLKQYLG